MPKMWNGTRLQTGWLHLRGAGRQSESSPFRPKPWQCAGCDRQHVATTERTIGIDGKNYCNKTIWAARDALLAAK